MVHIKAASMELMIHRDFTMYLCLKMSRELQKINNNKLFFSEEK